MANETFSNVNVDTENFHLQAMSTALNRVQAVIEFDLEGHILTANANFLSVMGYE